MIIYRVYDVFGDIQGEFEDLRKAQIFAAANRCEMLEKYELKDSQVEDLGRKVVVINIFHYNEYCVWRTRRYFDFDDNYKDAPYMDYGEIVVKTSIKDKDKDDEIYTIAERIRRREMGGNDNEK